jgi:hypothetical protein
MQFPRCVLGGGYDVSRRRWRDGKTMLILSIMGTMVCELHHSFLRTEFQPLGSVNSLHQACIDPYPAATPSGLTPMSRWPRPSRSRAMSTATYQSTFQMIHTAITLAKYRPTVSPVQTPFKPHPSGKHSQNPTGKPIM